MKTKFLQRVLWLMIPLLTIFTTNVWAAVTTYTSRTSAGTNTKIIDTSDAWTASLGASYNASGAYWACNQTTRTFTITCTSISDPITSIVVSGKRNKNFTYSISATVGGSTFGSTYSHAASSGNYTTNTLSNGGGMSGTVVLTITSAGAASGGGSIWVSSIVVTTAAASTFTVTYNANNATSGTVPTDATAYSSGATVTVKGNTGNLARTGYAFGGWNTQADGNGTNYTAGTGTFSITANTTLYAKWNPTYTVTYNGNGNTSGSVPTDATAYSSGATVTVKGNTGSLAKTGWTFAGWNKNNTGTSTNYTAGSGTFSITANTTLYAKWTCTVTWSVNGQTNVYSQQTITYNPSGSKVSSVPTPNPASYCGQVFAGWTTEEYSGNSAPSVLFKTVGDSPNLNSTGSITFYAVFADYAN